MRLFDHPAANTPAKKAIMPMTPISVNRSKSARTHVKNAIHASATKNIVLQKSGVMRPFIDNSSLPVQGSATDFGGY